MAACRAMNPPTPPRCVARWRATGRGFVLRETAGRLKANRWLLEHANIVFEAAACACRRNPKAE